MKKNVIFILLLTILSSCKSEYEEYSGTDAIYLNEISDTVRFSFTYVDSEYETQAQDIHLKVRRDGELHPQRLREHEPGV